MKTTRLDVRQWLICTAVALSIVAAAEIRKAVRRDRRDVIQPGGARPAIATPPGLGPRPSPRSGSYSRALLSNRRF